MLAPYLAAAFDARVRVFLAGTRFDFAYLPRVSSAIGIEPARQIRVWCSFKRTTAEELPMQLSRVIRLLPQEVAALQQMLPGRSRFWVYCVTQFIQHKNLPFKDIRDKIELGLVSALERELEKMAKSDKHFSLDMVSYYFQILFNNSPGEEANTLALQQFLKANTPAFQRQGGVFFIDYPEEFIPLDHADLAAGKYLPPPRLVRTRTRFMPH